MSIKETLEKRSPIYGPYKEQVEVRRELVETIRVAYYRQHGNQMEGWLQEAIWDIANKLSRISVTPTHIDSWHDIQGYAKLVEDTLQEGAENAD